MGNRKYSKSFEIALSGISCAVAGLGLSLGIMTGLGGFTAAGYCIGVLALMVPLSKQFFLGDFLAYMGTVILAVVLGATVKFWDIVPFAIFFGLHPLANALQIRFKINRWLALAIKTLWFDGTLIVAYYLVFNAALGGSLFPPQVYEVVNKYIFLFIFTLGSAAFFVYDYLAFKCQIAINKIVYKIKK